MIWQYRDFRQPCLSTVRVQRHQDESYVPMASPPPSVTVTECDGYIPMSPRTMGFLHIDGNDDSPDTHSSMMCQSGAFRPPPIHRHLKPGQRRGENQLRSGLDHDFYCNSYHLQRVVNYKSYPYLCNNTLLLLEVFVLAWQCPHIPNKVPLLRNWALRHLDCLQKSSNAASGSWWLTGKEGSDNP